MCASNVFPSEALSIIEKKIKKEIRKYLNKEHTRIINIKINYVKCTNFNVGGIVFFF